MQLSAQDRAQIRHELVEFRVCRVCRVYRCVAFTGFIGFLGLRFGVLNFEIILSRGSLKSPKPSNLETNL